MYWQRQSYGDRELAAAMADTWRDSSFAFAGMPDPIVLFHPAIDGGTLLLGLDSDRVFEGEEAILPGWHVSELPHDLSGWQRIHRAEQR